MYKIAIFTKKKKKEIHATTHTHTRTSALEILIYLYTRHFIFYRERKPGLLFILYELG